MEATPLEEYSTVRVVRVPPEDGVITGEIPRVGDEGTVVAVHVSERGLAYTVEESGAPPLHVPRWVADLAHDEVELVRSPSTGAP